MSAVRAITQPEQVLEDQLVAQLITQGCAAVAVTDEESMLANPKAQLEAFHGVALTTGEFTKELIQKPMGILERGPTRKRVLEKGVDYVATFLRGRAA